MSSRQARRASSPARCACQSITASSKLATPSVTAYRTTVIGRLSYDPDDAVGKGMNAIAARYNRLSCMNRRSTAPQLGEEPVVGEPVEPDHHEAQEEAEDLAVLVAERVVELRRPRREGCRCPTTSSVMAMANTASLKNATRSNSSSSERAPVPPRRGPVGQDVVVGGSSAISRGGGAPPRRAPAPARRPRCPRPGRRPRRGCGRPRRGRARARRSAPAAVGRTRPPPRPPRS